MSVLDLNPQYATALQRAGLEQAEDFLQLPGVIICGHPDRNVARITIGSGADALECFLKKEHRVRWSDRWKNAWAGFGFVSKSRREMGIFRKLRQAGIDCPDVIAAGEQGRQAFVLLRAVADAADLRSVLEQMPGRCERRRLAQRLGESLARIHAAGFDQPDLYSKHILIQPNQHLWFLDWQRSRRRQHVAWSQRCRDLAALDATLTEGLAGERARLACLRSYLRAGNMTLLCRRGLFSLLARRIRSCAVRLLERRYVRELRQAPLRLTEQRLIWIDGEAVCVTPEFRTEMGDMSAWLDTLRQPVERASEQSVRLIGERQAVLVRRRESRPWRWLWNKLRGSRPTSRELEQAATLFRLQRYGISSPRVLAIGQRPRPWGSESFLLTEPTPGTLDLADWLDDPVQAPAKQRHDVLRQAGVLVRRIHQAGYHLDPIINPRTACGLCLDSPMKAELMLTSAQGLRRSRKSLARLAGRDLRRLHDCFASSCSRTDLLRFILAYLDRPRLDRSTRALFGQASAIGLSEEPS